MEASRRGFLKGLVATAVAASLPAMPAPARERLTDNIAKLLGVQINGAAPYAVSLDDVGGGWYRLIANCRGGQGGGFSFMATGHPKGMAIVSDFEDKRRDAFVEQCFAEGHKYVASALKIDCTKTVAPRPEMTFEMAPHNYVLHSGNLPDAFGGREAMTAVGRTSLPAAAPAPQITLDSDGEVEFCGAALEQREQDEWVMSMFVKFAPEAAA